MYKTVKLVLWYAWQLAYYVANFYDTIEITVLGDHQVSSIKNLLKLLNFLYLDVEVPKSAFRIWLDVAAFASISVFFWQQTYNF